MSANELMGDAELETLRRRGFGVAYRMLGSVSEAEDVAQEALLRSTRQDGPIDEPAAWVTTVATRLSINVLRSARVRRESYVGPWLPEPLVEDPAPDPAARAERSDSLDGAGALGLDQDASAAWQRTPGLERCDQLSRGDERILQLVGADVGTDLVRPGPLDERDLAAGPASHLGAGQELGPAVSRVGAELRQAVLHE
jgi:hypothetical protein